MIEPKAGKAPPVPEKLAPVHLRLFALIMDYVAAMSILKVIEQLGLGNEWELRMNTEATWGFYAYWTLGLAFILLVKDARKGRSLGKWITGLVVVVADNPAIPAPRQATMIRNLFLALLPIEGVMVFIDPYYRRLGDRVAGTVVVSSLNVPAFSRRWLVVVIFLLGLMLASFLISPWNMRRTAAYRMARSIVSDHPDLIKAVGEPMELDNSPDFGMDLNPKVGRANLTFKAEGPKGEAEAWIELRLNRLEKRWELESFRVKSTEEKPPDSPVSNAP